MSRETKEFIVIIAAIIGLAVHIGFISRYEHKYNEYYTVKGVVEHTLLGK